MDLSNLAVNDGQTPTVSVDFAPESRTNELVVWHDQNPVIAQRRTISISRRLPSLGNGNYKYSVRVKVPSSALDPDTGKPIHFLSAVMDFIIPEAAVEADRADLTAFAYYSLATAGGGFRDLIKDGDFIF